MRLTDLADIPFNLSMILKESNEASKFQNFFMQKPEYVFFLDNKLYPLCI